MKDINYRSVSNLYVLFVWEVKSKRGSLFSKCQYVKRDPVHWHRRIGPLCQLSNLMNKSAGRKKFPILLPPLHKAVTRSRNEFALTLGLIYVLRLIRPHPPHMRSGIKMSLSHVARIPYCIAVCTSSGLKSGYKMKPLSFVELVKLKTLLKCLSTFTILVNGS